MSSKQQKLLLQDIGSGFQPEKYSHNLKYPKPIFEEKVAQILLFFFWLENKIPKIMGWQYLLYVQGNIKALLKEKKKKCKVQTELAFHCIISSRSFSWILL